MVFHYEIWKRCTEHVWRDVQNTPQQQLFCHLISFSSSALSMIHDKKSIQVYFSKIICGSRTKIYLYIMDLYLSVENPKSNLPLTENGGWNSGIVY